jgi:hypothetical protein
MTTSEGPLPATHTCPFEREIRVRVNPLFSAEQFLRTNLFWLGPSLIAAVAGSTLWKERKDQSSA